MHLRVSIHLFFYSHILAIFLIVTTLIYEFKSQDSTNENLWHKSIIYYLYFFYHFIKKNKNVVPYTEPW